MSELGAFIDNWTNVIQKLSIIVGRVKTILEKEEICGSIDEACFENGSYLVALKTWLVCLKVHYAMIM